MQRCVCYVCVCVCMLCAIADDQVPETNTADDAGTPLRKPRKARRLDEQKTRKQEKKKDRQESQVQKKAKKSEQQEPQKDAKKSAPDSIEKELKDFLNGKLKPKSGEGLSIIARLQARAQALEQEELQTSKTTTQADRESARNLMFLLDKVHKKEAGTLQQQECPFTGEFPCTGLYMYGTNFCKALDVETAEVPRLSFGLERVLFKYAFPRIFLLPAYLANKIALVCTISVTPDQVCSISTPTWGLSCPSPNSISMP